MVTLPNSPGSIKVQLIGTNQGALWMNQLHFATEAGAAVPQDPTAAITFLTSISTAWGANIAPLCNEDVELTALTFTDLTDLDRLSTTATLPTPIAGTKTGAQLPTSAAMVCSWRVSNRYRGGHGRIYVPAGVQADLVTGRLWSSAFQIAANTAVGTFRSTLDGLSVLSVPVNLVVLSYYSGSHKTPENPHPDPVLRPTPLAMRVTAARVRGRMDSQRRRLGKETV